MPKLMILQAGQAIPRELNEEEVVIGRLPECDLQLDSNMVSRRHARLLLRAGEYFIEDMGSGNGTFVNGKRIENQVALKHGDRLKLGPVLLRYESAATTGERARDEDLSDYGNFKVDVSSDNETNTIMGVAENSSGFGLLDVQPEAKLKAVIEISRSLAGTVDLDVMLPKILDTLFSIFPHADRG